MMRLRTILKNIRGVTAIEFGLTATLIAVATMATLQGATSRIAQTFENAASHLPAS